MDIMGQLSGGELKEVSSQEFAIDADFGKLVSLIYRNSCIGDGGDSDVSDSMSTPAQSPSGPASPLPFLQEDQEDQVQQIQREVDNVDDMFGDDNLDNMDFEDGMLFEGPNYAVNFNRNIEVVHNDLEFDEGVVRESLYRVHFDQSWENRTLTSIFTDLTELLGGIIERLRTSYDEADLVRFFITNSAFYSPQGKGLMPLRDLTLEQVLAHLEEILQSDQDLFLDEPLEIHVAVIRNPRGAGRRTGMDGLFTSFSMRARHLGWSRKRSRYTTWASQARSSAGFSSALSSRK